MKYDNLKTFHKVAHTLNFTKAARELFLTQPAVSQQIQSLEYDLGIILFDRSNKRIRLTSEGKILLSYTKRLFDLYDEIERLFDHFKHLEKGKITIGATAVMGTYFLPKIIGRFSKQYPGLDIDLQMGNSSSVQDLLLEGKLDFGFTGQMRAHPRLKSILIHRERLLMVCSNDNALASKKSVSVDELGKTPFIWREKGTQTRLLVEGWFEKMVERGYPQKSIELQNVEAAKRTVVEGYGITITPEIAVRREIHLGLLKPIDLAGFDLYFDYYLFSLKGQIFSRAAEAFIEMISGFQLLTDTENLVKRLKRDG